MARAYPVLARNDLPDNLLQFVDVRPNTSQANVPFEGVGNTGYLTHWFQNDAVVVTDIGAGVIQTNADYHGLMAYLIDNVENVGGGDIILTPAEAVAIANVLLARVAASQDLDLAAINIAINTPATVTNSDLNGVVANSDSTGSVADVLAILSGEVYLLPGGTTISGAGGAFLAGATPQGYFLSPGDTGYRHFRPYLWTGSLNLSCLSGQISKLNNAAYRFLNPSFTYGAGGTAQTIAGVAVPATGAGRAVVMYLNDGTAL